MSNAGGTSDEFTFPILAQPSTSTNAQPPPKAPLTAKSTVVEVSSDGSFRAPKPVVRQAFQRNKVALEKGFSQVDWLKLSRSQADLAGTGTVGLRKNIEMAEVKLHKTEDDAWMVLRGKVYNITHYLPFHPGGKDILVKVAGKDGSSLFQKYHPWVNADALLERCLVGWLVQHPPSPSPLQQSSQT